MKPPKLNPSRPKSNVLSRKTVERVSRYFLGTSSRVWKNRDGSYEIGRETNPGREVLGRGKSPVEAFVDTFMEKPAVSAPGSVDSVPDASQTADVAPGEAIGTGV